MRQTLYTVPCCKECNSIAGKKVFESIKDKRAFVQNKLKQKYKKWLKHPVWEADELDALGPVLKQSVLEAMRNRYIIEMRVSYPYPDTWIDASMFEEN